MFVCGFVPWYVGKEDGVHFPVVLPLGSFSWYVETVNKTGCEQGREPPCKRRSWQVYRYRVQILHGNLQESAVEIIEYIPPRMGALTSPLTQVFRQYQILCQTKKLLLSVARHNSVKHIYFTEEVKYNDMGASSGITLLDEFRRYTLTGKASEHSRLKSRIGDSISNVNDANIHWVREEFEQDCQTKTHVLPPNMEAHEMQSINLDDYIRIQDQVYDHQVHLFFNLPHAIANTSSRDRSRQEEHTLSEEQYTNIRSICNFLQTVAENTYSVIYDTSHVQIALKARPRLAIHSSDDVKKLFECGVFTSRDTVRLRQLFFPD